MAWIPIRTALPRDKRTRRLANILDIPRAYALGLLTDYLCWGDDHISADEEIEGFIIDDVVGLKGFSAAMADPSVGWIERVGDDLYRPIDWESQNGQSARARAMAQKRKANERSQPKRGKRVKKLSRSERDSTVTRGQDSTGDNSEEPPTPVKPKRTKAPKKPGLTCEQFLALVPAYLPAHDTTETRDLLAVWFDVRVEVHGALHDRGAKIHFNRLNKYPAWWVNRRIEDATVKPWQGLTFSEDPNPEELKNGNGRSNAPGQGQSPQRIGTGPGQSGHVDTF